MPTVTKDPGNNTERALLTLRELTEVTGLGYETLRRLAHQGRLPGSRVLGGRILVSRPVFERWLESSPPPRAGRRN